jgi:beta-ketoacyl synthase
MEAALRKAGVEPSEIGYINAHGTATQTNDASEVAAMLAVFGGKVPPFSSTKGLTGHTLGAAGGIEAVFTIKALQQGYRYRNTGFSAPMPEVDLCPIAQQACGCKYSYAMSNSFGFGGNCTSLIFSMEG